MSAETPKLPDFENLRKILPSERKVVIQVNEISDESLVRANEEALIILNFIEEFQTKIFSLFKEFPSLMSTFSNEYMSVLEFTRHDYIFDICFLDDCLFPEKDEYYFGQDGQVETSILGLHLKVIEKWVHSKKEAHKETQDFIKNKFDPEKKIKELACRCTACISDYRSQQRDSLHNECISFLEKYTEKIRISLEKNPEEASSMFKEMKALIDRAAHSRRHQLRRSTLNRLETQIKGKIKDEFCFPAEMAKKYAEFIIPDLKNYLFDKGYSKDLVTDLEYDKFFRQIRTNLWRGQNYLYREFFKFFRSLLILKRKDISSAILNTYLGEFWTHSQSRQLKRKIVYHMGPTNSGKTYHSIQALSKAGAGCYLAPLRLLAGELYDELNALGAKTTLLTGEEVIELEDATHISSTIEMARFNHVFDVAVIDEIQMIKDPQRGWAWTRALVNIFSPVVHVCGDHTAYDVIKNICDLCGDELEVKNYERLTKLEIQKEKIYLDQLEKGDALIVFSRRNALRYKQELEKLGLRVSIVYGRLSPEVRREQARKFDEGETDIIVSTDAISMGMNLPIKRIVFSTLSKYINNKEFQISNSEIKQIAGRAGRFGRFPVGYVNCLDRVEGGLEEVRKAFEDELSQSDKCMVGPDLEIFSQVNGELTKNNLPELKLSEFLRLFYTMDFKKPFYCVELNEMIELAEMVEDEDRDGALSSSEIFGFACAPVNMGLREHVQFYLVIINRFVNGKSIFYEPIDHESRDIDYLESSIKCIELYQWLSRHFDNKHFDYDPNEIMHNKSKAIEKLNELLSNKWVGGQISKQYSPNFGKRKGGGYRGKNPRGSSSGSPGGFSKKKKKFSHKRKKSRFGSKKS